MGAEVVLVLDRGNLELAIPKSWSVSPQPGGSVKVTDPRDACSLELSYLVVPGMTGIPPVAEFLEQLLAALPDTEGRGPVESTRRGPMGLAYCTYGFETMDTEQGRRRGAFGRWCLASRGTFHALLTAYWWEDDEPWARPVVERAIETLALGDGTQLRSPAEHWAMRDRN